jgi:hypothetical protein
MLELFYFNDISMLLKARVKYSEENIPKRIFLRKFIHLEFKIQKKEKRKRKK